MSWFSKLVAEIWRDYASDGVPASGAHSPVKADIRAWGGVVEEHLWQVLAHSAVAVSHTGDTSETALATVVVPGGTMGPNGILRVTSLWSFTNDADDKTLRLRFGAGLSGTQFLNIALPSLASFRDQRQIANRNAADSQVGMSSLVLGGWGQSANAPVTAAIDTTQSRDLVLSGQLESGADTVTLEAYLVEVLRRP
jgi:hypothetical protein